MLVDVLRILFYLALATSLTIYAWRLYRRVVHKETRHDREARRRAQREAGTDTGTVGKAAPGPDDGDRSSEPGAPRSFVRQAFAPPTVPAEPIDDGSLVRDVIRRELARQQGTDPAAPDAPDTTAGDHGAGSDDAGTGRQGLFAKRRRPVAELVAGIELPCELAPLVVGDDLDPHRVLFATTGHPPADVASGMADELERLGFRVDSAGDREAIARGPDGEVRVVIHEDLAPFPSAPRGAVVVELAS